MPRPGGAGYRPGVAHTYPPRDAWERVRREAIELTGVEECLPVLGIG